MNREIFAFFLFCLLCFGLEQVTAAVAENEQIQAVRNVVMDPISSVVGAFFVGGALLVWLKSKEGFTTKNAALITGQTVFVFLMIRHCESILLWSLDFDFSFVTSRGWPCPRGLLTGLWSVIIWHVVVLSYYAVRREMDIDPLQRTPPPRSEFFRGLMLHFARPEAFVMVFGYLVGVWMFGLLPPSYYDFEKPINYWNVLQMFLFVDFLIYSIHLLEHAIKPLYRIAHKQHHKYINPTLFDAFSGSITDTFFQIVVPLFTAAKVLPLLNVHISNWDFVLFGSLYANQFMMLHIEYRNPWDFLLEMFSIGTSEDHNVHHATFNYNYGHFFMIFDKLFGTYRSPLTVRALVRYGGEDSFSSSSIVNNNNMHADSNNDSNKVNHNNSNNSATDSDENNGASSAGTSFVTPSKTHKIISPSTPAMSTRSRTKAI